MEKDDEAKFSLTGTSHVKLQNGKGQCNWVTWTLLLLNLLLLAITITVVVVWRTSTHVTEHRPTVNLRENLCLPCADISLHQDDDDENFKNFTIKKGNDGSKLCCAAGGHHLDRLIEMVSIYYNGPIQFITLKEHYITVTIYFLT